MIPVTQEYLDVIRNSHQVSALLVAYNWDGKPTFDIRDYDALKTFEPDMVTPITPATYDGVKADYSDYNDIRHNVESGDIAAATDRGVKAVSGSVKANRKSRARRTLTAEIAMHDWEDVPLDIVSSRVQVWIGTWMGDFSMMIPVGVFRVDSIDRTNAETINIAGSSLEEYISDDKWTETGELSAGSPIIQTIQTIVHDAVPGTVVFDIHPEAAARDTSLAAALPYEVGDTKWDAVESLAFDLMCDVYCDPTGKFRIYPRPEPDDPKPVLALTQGPGGVMMVQDVAVTRDETYNGWVAMGESTSSTAPQSAIVLDDDPASPTRWGGPFGKRLGVYRSKLLDTKDKCRNKAELLLTESKALTRTLNLSAVPNPALEPDDVVEVHMVDGTVETHMIVGMEIPLGLGDWMAETLSNKKRNDVINPDRPIGVT
jgi:hypothetical protein